MFRLFFLLGFVTHIFAALPEIREARGYDISNDNASPLDGAQIGTIFLVGDSLKTPFRMQLIFENCAVLRDQYGFTLPLTSLKLKYIKVQPNTWETIELKLSGRGQNCYTGVQFYEDIQDSYYMELWATWNTKGVPGGTFNERATINILEKP